MIRFAEPVYLWFLLLLPLTWWLGRRLGTIDRGRRIFSITLRTLILLCLVLAIAKIELTRRSDQLTVYFLLDISDSVPPGQVDQAKRLVAEFSRRMTTKDEAGVIVFGETPSLEIPATFPFEFEGRLLSLVETTRTDIGGALRLAMSAFPADRMKRIVLFSDGNENDSSAVDVARLAKANDIPVDVVTLRYEQVNDVSIEKIVVPQVAQRDSPFDIKIYVNAEKDTKGVLRVYEDDRLIAEAPVDVQGGRKSPLILPRRLDEGGFHKYRAAIEVEGDIRPQNNRAEAYTYLRSEPNVLLVDGDGEEAALLEAALVNESIRVTRVGMEGIPLSIDEMQRYDSIIFSNVPASAMTLTQMRIIERSIHDLGIGFIMIGGTESFGAGGYKDSPIELALPVTMDIKQKKILPNGALCIILHTAEMPAANAWAREIAAAALNVLSPEDYFGIVIYGQAPGASGGSLAFSGYGDTFVWDPPLKMAGDKREMRNIVKALNPGDMPSMVSSMELAYKELAPLRAQVKHMVVISDGDAAPASQQLLNRYRDEGVTVSAVAIAPHLGGVETLERVAYWGAGNFYYPKTGNELPRIFTKEATVVRKSLIFEGTFTPVYAQHSDLLTGLQTGFPPLYGYVATSEKDLATMALRSEDDYPLLAHWRYGLGKTVAFTSDAKRKWAANWVPEPVYGKFWSQLVRWSIRETDNDRFQVATEVRGGQGRVIVDAVDDTGNFRNHLEFDTIVTTPDLQSLPVRVRQVAPGRYEGTFPAQQTGSYMVSMASNTGAENQEFITTGLSISYSPEYTTTRSNDEFMERIAEVSGGRVSGQGYNAFSHDVKTSTRPQPLWPFLLLLAMLLTPVDIFIRRVYLDWAEVKAWLRGKLTLRRSQETEATADQQRLGALRAAKDRALSKEEEAEEKKTRETFRDRLAKDAPADSGPSVFDRPDKSAPPVTHRSKQTTTTSEKGDGNFTGSLLEAKRRAQKKPPPPDDKK